MFSVKDNTPKRVLFYSSARPSKAVSKGEALTSKDISALNVGIRVGGRDDRHGLAVAVEYHRGKVVLYLPAVFCFVS